MDPSTSQPPVWDDGPSEGHLPVPVADRLVEVLRRHTATPDDCLFGRWDGFGYDLPSPTHPRGCCCAAAATSSSSAARSS